MHIHNCETQCYKKFFFLEITRFNIDLIFVYCLVLGTHFIFTFGNESK